MNILCVCTHNFFRSQITEHLLRARGYEDVRSGGTASAYVGAAPSRLVLDAIARHGGDCQGYAARDVSADDIGWSDHILLAEEIHMAGVQAKASPSFTIYGNPPTLLYAERIHSLWVMGVPDGGVDNPDAVERAAEQIAAYLDVWEKKV